MIQSVDHAPRAIMAARPLERKTIEVDGVLDIETARWSQFVMGGFVDSDGIYRWNGWQKEDAFVDEFLEQEGCWWAHNGGIFDWKWALDHIVKRGLKADVAAAGSRIVSVKVGKLRLYDSKALTKISLENLTKGTGVEKQKLALPCRNLDGRCCSDCPRGTDSDFEARCTCENACGGYCAISRVMPLALFRRCVEYLEYDCRSLLAALQSLQGWAEENDLDLAPTVGSAAWANMRRLLELPDAALGKSDHMFARDGYYGGRVQLMRPYSLRGWETDVNAMYPSRLAQCKMPCGSFAREIGKAARESYNEGRPGFYRCAVQVPDMHLPPLPVRTALRVCYPFGAFEGTWALPELRMAESLRCEITPLESLTWSHEKIIFKPWVEKIFALRSRAPGGKKGPFGTFLKFYSNAPTGKFGAKPDNERIVCNPDELRCCTCETETCDGDCGAHRRIGTSPWVYGCKTWRIDGCAHVEWSGYLTSEARVEWLTQALSLGNDGYDIAYGDTDSLFCETKRTRNIGDALGQWEDSGRYEDFRGVAPKVYRVDKPDAADEKAKRVVRAKGLLLPRKKAAADQIVKRAMQGERVLVSGDRIMGLKRSLRESGKFFEVGAVERTASRGYGDRIMEPGETVSRAPSIEEIDYVPKSSTG